MGWAPQGGVPHQLQLPPPSAYQGGVGAPGSFHAAAAGVLNPAHFLVAPASTPVSTPHPQSSASGTPMANGMGTPNASSWAATNYAAAGSSGPQAPMLPLPVWQRRACVPVVFSTLGGRVFSLHEAPSMSAAGGSAAAAVSIGCDLLANVLRQSDVDEGQLYVSALEGNTGGGGQGTPQQQALPLLPSVKADVVLAMLDAACPGSSHPLRDLLRLLLRKGTTFDWAQDATFIAKIASSVSTHSTQTLSAQTVAAASGGVVPSGCTPPLSPGDLARVEAAIQGLLIEGRRHDAVSTALHAGLFAHAIVIATVCDKDTYLNVVQRFVASTTHGPHSPLAEALRLFNEIPNLAAASVHDAASLSTWPEQVQLLITNFAKGAAEGLVAWGDTLQRHGQTEAAHFCYLVAQLSPAGSQPAVAEVLKNKYTLLGGVHRRDASRAALMSPQAIFMTEVFEFVRQQWSDKYVRPQLMPFKVAKALLFQEVGLVARSQQYLEHVTKRLPQPHTQSRKGPLDDASSRTLAATAERWKSQLAKAEEQRQAAANARKKSSSSTSGSGGTWWPFGGSSGGAAKQPQQAVTASSASSKVASSAMSAAAQPLPVTPSTASPLETAGQRPAVIASSSEAPGRKSWSVGNWLKIGRGSTSSSAPSSDAKGGTGKVEEKKVMILDDTAAPTYDPVTGRYTFEKTKEEEVIEQMIKAGPPPAPRAGARPSLAGSALPPAPIGGLTTAPPSHNPNMAAPVVFHTPVVSHGMPTVSFHPEGNPAAAAGPPASSPYGGFMIPANAAAPAASSNAGWGAGPSATMASPAAAGTIPLMVPMGAASGAAPLPVGGFVPPSGAAAPGHARPQSRYVDVFNS